MCNAFSESVVRVLLHAKPKFTSRLHICVHFLKLLRILLKYFESATWKMCQEVT